jgi:hypothetical protein
MFREKFEIGRVGDLKIQKWKAQIGRADRVGASEGGVNFV